MKTSISKIIYEYFRKFDKFLLILTAVCSAVSVLLLYSLAENGTITTRTYQIQAIASITGAVFCFILSAIDYKKIAKLWFLFAPLALILVLLTFTSLGTGVEGTDDVAWLNIGPTTIQPSEFMKIAFIMTFAYHLSEVKENINSFPHVMLLCLHGALPAALVAKQGDYGTAIIFVGIFLVMIFCSEISFLYILAAIIAIPIGGWIIWSYGLSESHKERILILLNPGSDPLGTEYQQNLGIKALASGELLGNGIFNNEKSTIPEVYNDFILAYMGQTLGFVGCVLLTAVLLYLCLKIFSNGIKAKDDLGKYICTGVFAMLFTHCFMNIGMVLKVMPVIGIPLPFLSAGGTAVLSMYIAIGLVMSVHSHSEVKYRLFRRSEPVEDE